MPKLFAKDSQSDIELYLRNRNITRHITDETMEEVKNSGNYSNSFIDYLEKTKNSNDPRDDKIHKKINKKFKKELSNINKPFEYNPFD